MGPLEEEDLLNIANSDFPLKRLSFQTYRMTDDMMDVIEKYSSTIEILEIIYPLHQYLDRLAKDCGRIIKYRNDRTPIEILLGNINIILHNCIITNQLPNANKITSTPLPILRVLDT